MVSGSSGGVCGGAWLGTADRPAGDLADLEARIMMQLREQSYIRKLSYRPLTVRDMQEEGIEIMDIQTGRASELAGWAKHYVRVQWPCFATRSDRKDGLVKLWIRRTVNHEGEAI